MNELNSTQEMLVRNWQRKNYQLSEVLITSLIGLTLTDTLNVLAQARKEKLWLKSITK
ncbi:MAG: hypothetical protein SOV02_07420 [Streptococcus infantarius]|nr:hypothetical protein [Streptococcus infantarius]